MALKTSSSENTFNIVRKGTFSFTGELILISFDSFLVFAFFSFILFSFMFGAKAAKDDMTLAFFGSDADETMTTPII